MVTSDQRTTAARSSQTIEDYSCFCTLATAAVLEYGSDSSADRQKLSRHRALRQLGRTRWSRSMLNSADRKTHPEVSSLRLGINEFLTPLGLDKVPEDRFFAQCFARLKSM